MKPFRFLADAFDASSAKELGERARAAEDLGVTHFVLPDHLRPAARARAVSRHGRGADRDGSGSAPSSTTTTCATRPCSPRSWPRSTSCPAAGSTSRSAPAGTSPSTTRSACRSTRSPVRQARLAEAIAVLKGCFGEGPFSFAGEHYTITDYDAYPKPVQRPHPPFFIGGGGRRTLELAGARGGHRRAGAADPVRPARRPLVDHLGGDRGEDRLGPRGRRRPVRRAGVQRLPVAVADRRDRRPPRRGAQGHRPDAGADRAAS